MKRLFLLLVIIGGSLLLQGQNSATESVKLYVSIPPNQNDDLDNNQRDRLEAKLVQLINNTGIADVGFSTFLVYPKIFINDVKTTEGMMRNFTTVSCDFNLHIARMLPGGTEVSAHLASYYEKIIGTGINKKQALSNAINQISPRADGLNNFIKTAKQKIINYYKIHCNEVLQEARQAYALKDFALSISWYFSIPSGVPCYKKAREESLKVYEEFKNDECRKQLLNLKGAIAVAQSKKDTARDDDYKKILDIIAGFDPKTDCYKEGLRQIEKIEMRFDAEQKREWDLELKKLEMDLELKKEKLQVDKEIKKISEKQKYGNEKTIIIKD